MSGTENTVRHEINKIKTIKQGESFGSIFNSTPIHIE